MDALKNKFIDSLNKRIEAMERACGELSAPEDGGEGQEAMEVLKFESHKLRGSGKTFGFPLLSRIAAVLEDRLQSSRPDPDEIARLVSRLRRLADNRGVAGPEETEEILAETGKT